MLKSMTGYGKATLEIAGKIITAEVRCLNAKQLDVNMRISSGLKELEMDIRSMVAQILERGKVEIGLTLENLLETSIKINTELFKIYFKALRELSETVENKYSTDIFTQTLAMPEIIASSKEAWTEEELKTVLALVKEACRKANEYRIKEAQALETDLKQRIELILTYLKTIERFESERLATIKERLNKSLNGLDIPFDANRFEQELIFYLEKLDITEEKVRLTQHCNYFLDTLQEDSCGRKLGFIAQEIGREINTIGSKCNHSEIQKNVVLMKDELEKIKEQGLNIL